MTDLNIPAVVLTVVVVVAARLVRIRVRRHLDAIAQIRADARFARTHRIDL